MPSGSTASVKGNEIAREQVSQLDTSISGNALDRRAPVRTMRYSGV